MPRALDHVVWPTRDLDGLAALFGRLGFTVGRRNRHPWGTVNHIVQFDGTFLELLGFAEDYVPLAPADDAFPFAGFCARFLARHEAGAAMLVLRSDDALADAGTMRAEGVGHGRTLPFARSAQGPDGSDRTVAFTIAFASLPAAPDLGAFLCEQHRPENFWSADAQEHANGAMGVAGLAVGVVSPEAFVREFRRFADLGDPGGGPDVTLPGGSRIVFEETAASDAPIRRLDVRVTSLPIIEDMMRRAGLATSGDADRLAVLHPALGGTRLGFVQGPARGQASARTSAAT